MIEVPQSVLDLPLEDLLLALRPFMNDYKRQHSGKVPFFGVLTCFHFVRLMDHYKFDTEGQRMEYVNRPYRLNEVLVWLA